MNARFGRLRIVLLATVTLMSAGCAEAGSSAETTVDAPSNAVETPEPPDATTSPAGEESAAPTEPPSVPPAAFVTFEDGTLEVGTDLKPGTYRLREAASFCYWARLKGLGGDLGEIIANENISDGYGVVSIVKTDKGFESSGCGEWSSDLSRVTPDTSTIEADGTYIVGTDIKAGKWRSSGGDLCYWARLKNFGGTLGAIIANKNVMSGKALVTIGSKDKGFRTSGCGTWKRV
jgi:hypothetical protein